MLMTQKDRRVLDRLESILGGKIYPRKSQGQWSWQLARRNDVMSACWLMWTWLDDIKREQFEKAFQDYHALA